MVGYHKSSAPSHPILPTLCVGGRLQIIGVRATLISNQKGQRLMGADDLWYPTMRKPPSASAPFDWKLMLL